MIITMVPREALPSVWPKVAGMLDKAIKTTKKRRVTNLQLYEACLEGQSDLWIVADPDTKDVIAAFTTHILQYPAYRALSVQYLGGTRMKEWFGQSHEILKSFAKDAGCETIEGYGREAWLRVLNNQTRSKWRKVYTMFEVDLTEDGLEHAAE